MHDRVIVGSPAECVAELRRWVERVGAEHVQLIVPPSRTERDLDERLATIRMLGAEAAAPLRDGVR